MKLPVETLPKIGLETECWNSVSKCCRNTPQNASLFLAQSEPVLEFVLRIIYNRDYQLTAQCKDVMQITVEIPDSLAGQLHLGPKADLRSLLQAMVEQHVSEGGLTVIQVDNHSKSGDTEAKTVSPPHEPPAKTTRPARDVLARLRGIYGDIPMTGENGVLAARRMERY